MLKSRTKAASNQPRASITRATPSASAPSEPGRTRSHRSASAAKPALRGSTTTTLAPALRAARIASELASQVSRGLWPHSTMQRLCAKSGVAMPRPKVSWWVKSLCQLQISVPLATLGLPKALARRSIQRMSSAIGVPLGVAIANATASGPDSARTRKSACATRSSASSHEISRQPGSASPLGRVRKSGRSTRCGS